MQAHGRKQGEVGGVGEKDSLLDMKSASRSATRCRTPAPRQRPGPTTTRSTASPCAATGAPTRTSRPWTMPRGRGLRGVEKYLCDFSRKKKNLGKSFHRAEERTRLLLCGLETHSGRRGRRRSVELGTSRSEIRNHATCAIPGLTSVRSYSWGI